MGNGDTYVNVHTADHPDGMIRGELKLKGSNSTNSADTTDISNVTSAE